MALEKGSASATYYAAGNLNMTNCANQTGVHGINTWIHNYGINVLHSPLTPFDLGLFSQWIDIIMMILILCLLSLFTVSLQVALHGFGVCLHKLMFSESVYDKFYCFVFFFFVVFACCFAVCNKWTDQC